MTQQSDNQKISVAQNFLDVAKQDLTSSKILYRNSLFPQALFFLQQSVEKGYKSYHLLSELDNDKKDLKIGTLSTRKIGHTPTKITERIASKAEKRILSIKENIGLYPHPEEIYAVIGTDFSRLIRDLSESRKKYSQISKKSDMCKNINYNVLDELLSELFQLSRRSNETIRVIRNITFDESTKKRMKKEYEKLMIPIFQQIPGNSKNQIDEFTELFGDNFEQFEPTYKAFMEIFVESGYVNAIYAQLSVITQAHENLTRYPEIDKSPLLIYSQRHPIIRRFNTITWFTSIAHRKMDNFFIDTTSNSL